RYTVSSMVSSLVSSLERPVFIGDTEILPSVLIGVCQFPVDGESSDSLLSNCFSAAFNAKRKNLKWSFYC
ncbi:giguanylate cyclase, partial [Mesotoga sp. SC_4PWL113PWK15]